MYGKTIVRKVLYIVYKMKYGQEVTFGYWQFIEKLPIFNSPIIMNVCHVLVHFI